MAFVPGIGGISQVGIVVNDINKAMESYWLTAGIGPWSVYTTGAPPLRCVYHDHPADYKIKLATAMTGSIQLELIEYVSGDTIHRDFLALERKGVEHVGIFVQDLEEALQPYLSKGVGVLQRAEGLGVKGDGRYAYLDTELIFGTVLELIQSSTQPISPERIYPELPETKEKER